MPDDRNSTTIYNFPSLVRDSYESHLFLRYPERFQLRAVLAARLHSTFRLDSFRGFIRMWR
jgi:hypothetical protein